MPFLRSSCIMSQSKKHLHMLQPERLCHLIWKLQSTSCNNSLRATQDRCIWRAADRELLLQFESCGSGALCSARVCVRERPLQSRNHSSTAVSTVWERQFMGCRNSSRVAVYEPSRQFEGINSHAASAVFCELRFKSYRCSLEASIQERALDSQFKSCVCHLRAADLDLYGWRITVQKLRFESSVARELLLGPLRFESFRSHIFIRIYIDMYIYIQIYIYIYFCTYIHW